MATVLYLARSTNKVYDEKILKYINKDLITERYP